MPLFQNILETFGHTPVVRISRLAARPPQLRRSTGAAPAVFDLT
jgi:hypothetical protein